MLQYLKLIGLLLSILVHNNDILTSLLSEICALPPHPGRCPGPFLTRWFYDPKLENCAQFDWSGCRGNNNRFLSQEDCKTACQAYAGKL